jgi:hypothetical protein
MELQSSLTDILSSENFVTFLSPLTHEHLVLAMSLNCFSDMQFINYP